MRSENCILCYPSFVLYQFPTWYRTIASHEQLYNYSFFYSSHVLLCQRRGKKMRYGPKSWRIGFATPYALRTMEAEMVVSRCGFIPEKVSKFFASSYMTISSIVVNTAELRKQTAILCHTPLSLKLAPSGLEWFNIFLSSLMQKNVVLLL